MTADQSMLLDTFMRKLKEEIPSLSFSIDEEEESVVIAPICEEFGAIEIIDDGDELIVEAGKFTHWHASCYDTTITAAQRAEAIAEEVVEFIKDIVNDRVFLWGSHRGGGGFAYTDESPSRDKSQNRSTEAGPFPGEFSSSGKRKWLWSGPLPD